MREMVAGAVLQVPELPRRIRGRIDLRMRLGDDAVLVDHIGDAPRERVVAGVGGAVRDADLLLRVAKKREWKVVLLGEAPVLVRGIETDAENLRVLRLELGLEVPEPGTFARSTGGVGLRIEPEDDFLSPQIGKADAVAEVIGNVEAGGGGTGREHRRFSSQKRTKDSSNGHRRLL
jgi:hypothetical protein